MRVILLSLISLLFFACADVNPTSDYVYLGVSKDKLDGMIRVTAYNATAILGTNDTAAKLEEYPQMKVKVDYSFSMGKHEVTCGEFNKLMKPQGLKLSCINKNLPATDMTYYDAVLFANEKSKAENFDTVYSYSSKQIDSDGHCTFLEGFYFHTDVDGYRLPTEAEWVVVAGRNWNPRASWNAENSGIQLHEVCTRISDSTDFCDMAGNAMEWVNDWLGFFRDTTIYNYTGSPDGGNMGKRIVKGGSYRQLGSAINLYSRTDVYTITSSTRAEYVGFRLAFGQIPDAVWMDYDGIPNSKRVISLVNQRTLKNHLDAYKVVLAFRNNLTGNLAYVNYSDGTIYTAEIKDTLEVYHPDVSPNGRFVAFSTGLEGVSGKSEVYVRTLSLGYVKIIKLKVDNASIPRWRVLPNGDTVIVYVTDAGDNRNDGSFKRLETWQVKFQKERFGRPQKLFDGAYHDGISGDERLAVTGARLLRAKVAQGTSTLESKASDTVWYNGEQACNASLATDGSKKTLFLDFSGETGRKFVGESYGVHERILVMDSTGKLISSIKAPLGYSFDHTEWVRGRSDYAVATLTEASGMHRKIVLVNMQDSSMTDLVEGDDLWQPCLWIPDALDKSKFEVDGDSAGVYMHAGENLEGILMRYNMELIWRYRDTANVVIVGSSRPLHSVSPRYLVQPFYAINLAQTPNSIYMSKDFLDFYIYPHFKKLKYIVISLDIDFWYKTEKGPNSDNFFNDNYKNYAGFVYDKNHNYWQDGYPEGLLEYTENYMTIEGDYAFLDDRGRMLGTGCKPWSKNPDIEMDSLYYDDHPETLENSMKVFKKILEKAEERGVSVVGVIFPQNPAYRKTGAFGRYGLRRSRAKELIDDLKALEKTYPHFRLLDENKMGKHDYDEYSAADEDHLCARAAPQITKRIEAVLKELR